MLNDELLINLEYIKNLDGFLFIQLDTLYTTGLRPVEVFEPNRWQELSESEFIVALSKNNGFRKIKKSSLNATMSNIYKNEISSNALPSVRYNERQYNKLKIFTHKLPDKNLSLYVFRHNFVKNLLKIGLSAEQIKRVLQHADIKNTYHYINSSILSL